MSPKIWLITGTTSGFGEELVKVVLKKGDIAVATARDPSKLDFSSSGATSKNYLAAELDVTKKATIDSAFKAVQDTFGKSPDVVVNNAGYGLSGEFEGFTDEQVRTQMEVNFFGLVDVTRKAMQLMRESGNGGVIQQVTSIGGQLGVPTYSIYCASKWAVEGFTEAISKEVKPEWKIKFTNIEPGPFRTEWSGRSMLFGENHPAYDHIDAKKSADAKTGKQPGDPYRAAEAMYELGVSADPPLRVVLGKQAYQGISNKLKTYQESVSKYEKLSVGCDFPDA